MSVSSPQWMTTIVTASNVDVVAASISPASKTKTCDTSVGDAAVQYDAPKQLEEAFHSSLMCIDEGLPVRDFEKQVSLHVQFEQLQVVLWIAFNDSNSRVQLGVSLHVLDKGGTCHLELDSLIFVFRMSDHFPFAGFVKGKISMGFFLWQLHSSQVYETELEESLQDIVVHMNNITVEDMGSSRVLKSLASRGLCVEAYKTKAAGLSADALPLQVDLPSSSQCNTQCVYYPFKSLRGLSVPQIVVVGINSAVSLLAGTVAESPHGVAIPNMESVLPLTELRSVLQLQAS